MKKDEPQVIEVNLKQDLSQDGVLDSKDPELSLVKQQPSIPLEDIAMPMPIKQDLSSIVG